MDRSAGTARGGWIASPGLLVIVLLAIISTVVVAARSKPDPEGVRLWLFAREHARVYEPIIDEWTEQTGVPVTTNVLDIGALDQRVRSAFMSGTPIAPAVEMVYGSLGNIFRGPVDAIGFEDLTDRLARDGLLEQLNPPSLSPWTSRGRLYGLPHDVHPVLLLYRADITEAHGIDLAAVETWDEFEHALAPLAQDSDNDGKPDHRHIAFWHTDRDSLELLIRQAGGRFFDEQGNPTLASDVNATVLARLATWVGGPARIAADIPDFQESGDIRKARGDAIAFLAPDWMTALWKRDIPDLAGKVKLMPLPAWEPGGRRTSVRGGTMLGLAKDHPDMEDAWRLATHLYFSRDVAERTFRDGGIITPVRRFWSLDIFDEPDPYFSNQPAGRLYVNAAPHVPPRTSHPFGPEAATRAQFALIELQRIAERDGVADRRALIPQAKTILEEQERGLVRLIERNVFLTPERNADDTAHSVSAAR